MTDPNALLGEMAAALQSLANEASVGVEAVRAEWGNTNANCLQRRINQARALLSSDAAQAALRERDALLEDRRRLDSGKITIGRLEFVDVDLRRAIDAAMGERGK